MIHDRSHYCRFMIGHCLGRMATRCVFAYKYRAILVMVSTLMKLCCANIARHLMKLCCATTGRRPRSDGVLRDPDDGGGGMRACRVCRAVWPHRRPCLASTRFPVNTPAVLHKTTVACWGFAMRFFLLGVGAVQLTARERRLTAWGICVDSRCLSLARLVAGRAPSPSWSATSSSRLGCC